MRGMSSDFEDHPGPLTGEIKRLDRLIHQCFHRTRKSAVYRRARPSWQNDNLIGREIIDARASKNAVSVTKSRSSALSCAATPVASGWKPVMWERRLSGRNSLTSFARQGGVYGEFPAKLPLVHASSLWAVVWLTRCPCSLIPGPEPDVAVPWPVRLCPVTEDRWTSR
jgi:hypothetical protein